MNLSWEYLIMFVAFVGVSYLMSKVKGDEAKNEAVGVVNHMAQDAYHDLRKATKMLLEEAEKRARLEGRLEQQDTQITALYNDIRGMDDKFKSLQERLDQVEKEKAKLLREKQELQTSLGDLTSLLDQRVEHAISDAREQMRQHYQDEIARLEQQIREKDAEIERLKIQLEKEAHNENSHHYTDSSHVDVPAPDTNTGADRRHPPGSNRSAGDPRTDD